MTQIHQITTHDLTYKFWQLPITAEVKGIMYALIGIWLQKQETKKELLKAAESVDYKNVEYYAAKLKHTEHDNLVTAMKQLVWEKADPVLLETIASNQPLRTESKYSWSDLLIPAEAVLPKFSSYSDTFAKTDPKAAAAKLLGAKII